MTTNCRDQLVEWVTCLLVPGEALLYVHEPEHECLVPPEGPGVLVELGHQLLLGFPAHHKSSRIIKLAHECDYETALQKKCISINMEFNYHSCQTGSSRIRMNFPDP